MADVDKLLEHAERIEEFAAAARAGMDELQPLIEALTLENERLQQDNDRLRTALGQIAAWRGDCTPGDMAWEALNAS
jgi:regulator of replication initiation timing